MAEPDAGATFEFAIADPLAAEERLALRLRGQRRELGQTLDACTRRDDLARVRAALAPPVGDAPRVRRPARARARRGARAVLARARVRVPVRARVVASDGDRRALELLRENVAANARAPPALRARAAAADAAAAAARTRRRRRSTSSGPRATAAAAAPPPPRRPPRCATSRCAGSCGASTPRSLRRAARAAPPPRGGGGGGGGGDDDGGDDGGGGGDATATATATARSSTRSSRPTCCTTRARSRASSRERGRAALAAAGRAPHARLRAPQRGLGRRRRGRRARGPRARAELALPADAAAPRASRRRSRSSRSSGARRGGDRRAAPRAARAAAEPEPEPEAVRALAPARRRALEALWARVPTSVGKALSRRERGERGASFHRSAFVYGEASWEALAVALSRVRGKYAPLGGAKRVVGGTFYAPRLGRGKMVLAAAVLQPFARAEGVEPPRGAARGLARRARLVRGRGARATLAADDDGGARATPGGASAAARSTRRARRVPRGVVRRRARVRLVGTPPTPSFVDSTCSRG